MASRPRRTTRQPQRYGTGYEATEVVPLSKKPTKPKKDNALYEVEITEVNKEKKMVRIHFKGYDTRFDEWRPFDNDDGQYFPFVRHEKLTTLTATSLDDRVNRFQDLLYRSVKRALYCGRKDDPDVRLEINVDEDAFNLVLGNIVEGVMARGRMVYFVPSNRCLDDVLGKKWDERISNVGGDYCFVAEGTVKFWLGKKSPIVEYKRVGGKLVKTEIEDFCLLVFTFVRGTGNNTQYQQRHFN